MDRPNLEKYAKTAGTSFDEVMEILRKGGVQHNVIMPPNFPNGDSQIEAHVKVPSSAIPYLSDMLADFRTNCYVDTKFPDSKVYRIVAQYFARELLPSRFPNEPKTGNITISNGGVIKELTKIIIQQNFTDAPVQEN